VPKHIISAVRLGSILLSGMVLLSLTVPSRADMAIYGLYDLRHMTDPTDNSSNFPVIEMKGFFPESFGSFLFKEEIDLDGAKGSQSEVYSELDQTLKLGGAKVWGTPLSLHLGYSGGLGVFGNAAGGYYIRSSYSAGPEYGFRIGGAYCDAYAALRYTYNGGPRFDPMLSFWVGNYLLGYRLLIANSLEAWTTSYGPGSNSGAAGSRRVASWELESEVWYKVAQDLSVGTYIRTTRNVYALSGRWVIYPSLGIRYSF